MAWHTKKLGEVCSLIKRGIAPKYVESAGIAVINQKCIRDHQINMDPSRRHNHELKAVNPERIVQFGDVLVNSTGTGTLGRVAQMRQHPEEPTTVDTHVTIVRPAPGRFYEPFFGYMMIRIEDELIASGEGASGQTELARSKLEDQFEVSFPDSIDEQKRIVAILDQAFEGIDKAIANTEQNLKNARELFGSSLDKLLSPKQSGWINRSIGQLVSSGTLEKPLDGNHGEIHPKKSDYVQHGVPFVMASDLVPSGVDEMRCNFISEAQAKSLRKGFARSGDVLLSHKGTIGRVALLETQHPYVMLTPQVTYYRVIDSEVLSNEFLYFVFQSGYFQKAIGDIAGAGSTRAYIGITKQLQLRIALPPASEQGAIVHNLRVLNAEAIALQNTYSRKVVSLRELKRSLLQTAFSGELTAATVQEAMRVA